MTLSPGSGSTRPPARLHSRHRRFRAHSEKIMQIMDPNLRPRRQGWVRILARRKLQTLSHPTHKDSDQYLSRLLQNIRLKIHDFGNFQEMSPKSEKTQNPNSSARSNQYVFANRQKCVFNTSALEGSDLVMFDAQEFRSISCTFAYMVFK